MAEHLGDMACAYAAEGQAVFPCGVRQKCPLQMCTECKRTECRRPDVCGHLLCHGLLAASTDVDLVDGWWREDENRNIGGRPAEGIKVIDIDRYHGGGETWARLCEGRAVPETLTCVTPGGGVHLWFACRGSARGKLGGPTGGIDVKSHTGYLIMPPSVHPNGGRYRWEDPDALIAPCPSWLADLLRPPVPVSFKGTSGDPSRRYRGLLDTVLKAKVGNRNDALLWSCCRAVEAGLDLEPLIEAAVHVGLPAWSARSTAKSAMGRAA